MLQLSTILYLYHGLSLNSPLDGLNPLILKGGFNIIKAKAIGALAVNKQFILLTYTYLRHTALCVPPLSISKKKQRIMLFSFEIMSKGFGREIWPVFGIENALTGDTDHKSIRYSMSRGSRIRDYVWLPMCTRIWSRDLIRIWFRFLKVLCEHLLKFLERYRFPSVPFRTHMIPEYFVQIYRSCDRHFVSGPCAFMHRLLIREK